MTYYTVLIQLHEFLAKTENSSCWLKITEDQYVIKKFHQILGQNYLKDGKSKNIH